MSDGKVRLAMMSPGEVLALQLARTATIAAVEALRVGGYPQPTPEQFREIARLISREATTLGLLLVDQPDVATDDELDEAAGATAWAMVREVLGPPPGLN